MALSRTLTRAALHPSCPTAGALIGQHRHRSSKAHQAQLIELDLDQSQADSPESITVGVKRLEEAIHSIMVRRAAPDWLPFLPGYSYWVPPRATANSSLTRHTRGLLEAVSMLGAAAGKSRGTTTFDLMTEDETMSFNSMRGWPSSSYFIQGTSPTSSIPVMEVEVDMEIQDDGNHADRN